MPEGKNADLVALRQEAVQRHVARLAERDHQLAQALFEQVVYDLSSGQLLTGSLMDYCAPRADQLPRMSAEFDESIPCKTNLLGVKGCGELGTIGSVPAVVHAVLDAMRERNVGHVGHLEMPLTQEKVWRALQPA